MHWCVVLLAQQQPCRQNSLSFAAPVDKTYVQTKPCFSSFPQVSHLVLRCNEEPGPDSSVRISSTLVLGPDYVMSLISSPHPHKG